MRGVEVSVVVVLVVVGNATIPECEHQPPQHHTLTSFFESQALHLPFSKSSLNRACKPPPDFHLGSSAFSDEMTSVGTLKHKYGFVACLIALPSKPRLTCEQMLKFATIQSRAIHCPPASY